MATYFLNADSATEDGLTPETGFHSFKTLHDSAISFTSADIFDFVGDFTLETATVWYGAGIPGTLRSYSGNAHKSIMTVNTGGYFASAAHATVQDFDFRVMVEPTVGIFEAAMAPDYVQRCEFRYGGAGTFTSISSSPNYIMRWENCIFHDLPQVYTGNGPSAAVYVYNCILNGVKMFSGSGRGVANDRLFNSIVIGVTKVWENWQYDDGTLGAVADYDCLFNSPDSFGQGAHNRPMPNSITSDPLLNVDYTLQAGSPCLSTGIGPTADANVPTPAFNGNARTGATTDMGAVQTVVIDPVELNTAKKYMLPKGSIILSQDTITMHYEKMIRLKYFGRAIQRDGL